MTSKTIQYVFTGIMVVYSGEALGQASEIADISGADRNSTLDRESETVRRAIEIKTGKDSSNVSIKIGGALSDNLGRKDGSARFSSWSVTASAPVDKQNSNTDVATLDGLANGFSLEWKYNQFRAKRRNPMSNPTTISQSDKICDEAEVKFTQKRLDAAGPDADKAEIRKLADEEWLCDQFNVKASLPSRYKDFRALYWDLEESKSLWGVALKVGYDEYSFLNPTDGAKQKTDETPWSAKLYYGLIPANTQSMYVFGVEYQDAFKNADSGTICQPPDVNGIQTCATDAVGSPRENDKELLFVEWRGLVNLGSKTPAGMSVRLTRDFEGDKTGIDVPILFWKDKDSKMNGGVRVGWTSDPSDFNFGIIVGSSFTLTDKY